MMKTSLKIVLKKTKLSDGTYPINLRVTINRRSKFYKTPYSTAPKFWNAKVGEFTSKFANFLQANRILSTLKQDASKVLDLMIEQEKEFTLEVFDSLLRPEKVEIVKFVAFFQNRIEQFKEAGQVSSASSYNDSLKALKRFKPGVIKYEFTQIDYSFLVAFEADLRSRGCTNGGIGIYMRNIRAIYNSAIKSKIASLENYPFRDYVISKLKSTKIKKALTKEELQLLLDYDFSENTEGAKVLYTYLFSFFCRGMNFTDIAELKWDDINSNRFSYIRNKTGVAINVKIPENKDLDTILNYFRIYRPFDTDYIFSILDKDIRLYTKEELRARKSSVRDYYNKQLDIIAKECGIKTKITFYTARHTFATLSLKKGVNLYMLKQAFGHQSIKTTEAYVEDFNRDELDQAFENLF